MAQQVSARVMLALNAGTYAVKRYFHNEGVELQQVNIRKGPLDKVDMKALAFIPNKEEFVPSGLLLPVSLWIDLESVEEKSWQVERIVVQGFSLIRRYYPDEYRERGYCNKRVFERNPHLEERGMLSQNTDAIPTMRTYFG